MPISVEGLRMTMDKMEFTGVENVIGKGRLVVWLLGHKWPAFCRQQGYKLGR